MVFAEAAKGLSRRTFVEWGTRRSFSDGRFMYTLGRGQRSTCKPSSRDEHPFFHLRDQLFNWAHITNIRMQKVNAHLRRNSDHPFEVIDRALLKRARPQERVSRTIPEHRHIKARRDEPHNMHHTSTAPFPRCSLNRVSGPDCRFDSSKRKRRYELVRKRQELQKKRTARFFWGRSPSGRMVSIKTFQGPTLQSAFTSD